MAVGDFQTSFQREAQLRGIDLTPEQTLNWLSGHGHLEEAAASAPTETRERLGEIHAALGGSPQGLSSKQRRLLPVDFLIGPRIIVELDETQHFTSARLRTLDFYDGLQHGLDVPRYRQLCIRHADSADAYWAQKTAADFLFPGGRSAQRAYLDAVRDLLGPAFEYHVIRIPTPGKDVRLAVDELVTALGKANL